jgi:hypothetical protein
MRKRDNHPKLKFCIGNVRKPRCDLSYAKFVAVGELRIAPGGAGGGRGIGN